MLKNDKDNEWDEKIASVIMHYNNNVHSVTNLSPSQCILTKSHTTKPSLAISGDIVSNWREGNPNFCPFKPRQKVLKRIQTIGKQLKDKLGRKYDGPYVITKVQSNGLSYEISKVDDANKILKVNHRQLRPYHELPGRISRYLRSPEVSIDKTGEYAEDFLLQEVSKIYTSSGSESKSSSESELSDSDTGSSSGVSS